MSKHVVVTLLLLFLIDLFTTSSPDHHCIQGSHPNIDGGDKLIFNTFLQLLRACVSRFALWQNILI